MNLQYFLDYAKEFTPVGLKRSTLEAKRTLLISRWIETGNLSYRNLADLVTRELQRRQRKQK